MSETPTSPPASRRFGKYEILGQIGKGGMSTVYRARLSGPAAAHKDVALKLIHAHLSRDDEFVLMFLDEMRLAMPMAHRNIVQTFDADQSGDHYFMAMEWIDGCSLRDLLLAGAEPLPLDVALFICRETAAALDYAHDLRGEPGGERVGLIHRDVSPANILLSRQGDVKLADFGIAKATGRLGVTLVNVIKGKLSYMAPEQARSEPVARSDVFSLGAVLYELIAGVPLRDEASLDDVRSFSGIVPPSRLPGREAPPAELQRLLERCLDPKAGERPTAGELRRALSELHAAVQRSDRGGDDPHESLATLLAARLPAVEAAAGGGEPQAAAARVAEAMWHELDGMPTEPEAPAQRPVRARDPENDPTTAKFPRVDAAELASAPSSRGEAVASLETADPWVTVPMAPSPVMDASPPPASPSLEQSDARTTLPMDQEALAEFEEEEAPTVPGPGPGLGSGDGDDKRTTEFDRERLDLPRLPADDAAHGIGAPALGSFKPVTEAIDATPARRRGPVVAAAAVGVALVAALGSWCWWPSADPQQAVAGAADGGPRADVAPARARSRDAEQAPDTASFAVDGAVAEGAVADGAVADGAVADGAVADGAVADGAVADGGGDLKPAGAPPRPRKPRRRSSRRGSRRAGRLYLNSEPWSRVWIDGRPRGETPLQGLRLSPGVHRVRLYNPSKRLGRRFRVRIRPGRSLRKSVVLRR